MDEDRRRAAEPARPAARRSADDRYGTLLEGLRGSGDAPGGANPSAPKDPVHWHPIAIRLVIAAIVVAAVYTAGVFGFGLLRDARVDTWTGPDAAVQSGQRLTGCPEVEQVTDDVFPSWIRYGGAVYRLAGAVAPIGADTGVGETKYTETGYSFGPFRLLVDDRTEAGRARERIYALAAPAMVAETYARTSCR
jgi:hypothetical protein